MEVVDFFRKPEKFRASGARPPKGVLLVGPPGEAQPSETMKHAAATTYILYLQATCCGQCSLVLAL